MPRESGWRRRGGSRSTGDGRRRAPWPSSRKNSSVQLLVPITSRRRPLNSQTHTSHACRGPALVQQGLGRGIMDDAAIARERPRCGVAMMSPVGVTRFCSGIGCTTRCQYRHCERSEAVHLTQAEAWIASSLALLAMTEDITPPRHGSGAGTTARYPREEDPGVLRHFGNKSIDGAALRLGVDGGEMRIRQHVADQPPCFAGIDEVVDDQQPLCQCRRGERGGIRRDALPRLSVTPCLLWS